MDKLIEIFKSQFFVDGKPNLLLKILLSVLVLLIAGVITIFINRFIKKHLVKYINNRGGNNKKLNSVVSILSNILKYITYFLAILVILNIFGVNTNSLIATAGVGGIIIAFGVQSVVRDLFNGIFILFDDQYNIGDEVVINGINGEVVSINIRNTTIRGFDGSINIISHGSITTVTNKSKQNQRSMVDIFLPLDADIEKVRGIIEKFSKIFEKENTTITETPNYFGVTAVGVNYLKITVRLWSKASKQAENEKKYREGILSALKKENIEFLKFDLKGENNV